MIKFVLEGTNDNNTKVIIRFVDNNGEGGMTMHVSGKPVHRISQIYNQQAKIEHKQKNKVLEKEQDIVTLSDEGKELQAVLQKVYLPQEPSSNANRIKEEFVSGNYSRSGEEIAASILKYFK